MKVSNKTRVRNSYYNHLSAEGKWQEIRSWKWKYLLDTYFIHINLKMTKHWEIIFQMKIFVNEKLNTLPVS